MFKVGLFLLISFCFSFGYTQEIKILVDASTSMPMAKIEGDQILGGIHKELGIAIAKELGKKPVFTAMPRKRVALNIEKGSGDLSCQYLPEWMSGDFDWTVPFMPNGILLISDASVPAPKSMTELRGVPIGTVLGFYYPEVDAALKDQFIREDAPSALLNLQKFVAGRMHHALVGELFYDFQLKAGVMKKPVHPPLVIKKYLAHCVVSKKGRVSVVEVNKAIDRLKRSGKLSAIYKKQLN